MRPATKQPQPVSPPRTRPMPELPSLFSRPAARVEWKKAIDRVVGIPLQWLANLLDLFFSPWFPKPPVQEVRRIVLVKLWGIGNLAMILPYVDAIARRYPGASVEFLTLARNGELLEGHPHIDRVLTLRENGLFRPLRDLFSLIRDLRRQPVDLFLDFEQFLRAPGLLAWCGGVRQSIGFDTPGQHRARLHQARVPYNGSRHMRDVFGDIVRAAGVSTDNLPPLLVPRCDVARDRARDHLPSTARPYILIHPGSGDNFPGRRWPTDRFAELARTLGQERNATIVLSGIDAERPLLDGLARHLSDNQVRCIDLGGALDLPTWIEVLAEVDLVVTNDTGPVHLASAVGTPTVALYGPNTPDVYGPLGVKSRAIYHPLPCSPCLTNLNAKSSSCRLPACIQSITTGEVGQACRDLLDESKTTP